MNHMNVKTRSVIARLVVVTVAMALLFAGETQAAVPGITSTGTSGAFNLDAAQGYITQPDGAAIYSWGYGCAANSTPTFVPYTTGAFCPAMQIPGPTLIVTENVQFTVTLTNHLPAGVGNTSILFPGLQLVSVSGGVPGLLTQEAIPNGAAVTYTLVAHTPGTHAYYSGTQEDLQIEMGLYGAVVVKPAHPPGACPELGGDIAQLLGRGNPEHEYRLAPSAYDHAATCYDREYLTQWMELDARIHRQAETQLQAIASCPASSSNPCPTTLDVRTEPYHPAYFLINVRSMPDNMDPSYAPNYPNQPYGANPHMHPGDLVLVRVVGQGHWQHPFHEHGNHVRILARDGNLILSETDTARLAGRMEFTTDTTPGQAFDGIFYWSGKGLGWDIFAHTPPTSTSAIASASESGTTVTITTSIPLSASAVVGDSLTVSGLPTGYNGTFTITSVGSTGINHQTVLTYTDPNTNLPAFTWVPTPGAVAMPAPASVSVITSLTDPTPCHPDANGYYTTNSGAPLTASNYYEWCADHQHPLETNPVSQVGGGGPMTLPDPLIMTNGLWYNGTPYLGPDAVGRSRGPTPLPPGGALQNPPNESGIAFMWHSHNEREITTNDLFPGGMLMMMLVDPPTFFIDETL